MTIVVQVWFFAAVALYFTWGILGLCGADLRLLHAIAAGSSWCFSLTAVAAGEPAHAALTGLTGAYFVWLWWRSGGGRGLRRTARQLGAKSAARVQALVRQMTPSPVPLPGGAG